MTKFLKAALIVLVAFWIADVSVAQEASAAESEEEKASALARALANPVANLWSLQFQFNNVQLTNDRWSYNLDFQTVMPLSLTNRSQRPRPVGNTNPVLPGGRYRDVARAIGKLPAEVYRMIDSSGRIDSRAGG